MNVSGDKQTSPREVPSAAACAQAAAWIARLHGANRTAEVENGFRHWLAASAEHRVAFEMANDLWAETERWPRPTASSFVRRPRAGVVLSFPRVVLAAVSIAVVVLLGAVLYLRDTSFTTQIGEQRHITLDDGTRVSLNTATRLRPAYDEKTRRVYLEVGEALFDVTKQADRPFVVVVGGRQITALGTAFMVRYDSHEALAVTLVEGKVAIESMPGSAVAARIDTDVPSGARFTLDPGERLTFSAKQAPRLDRPQVSEVAAWQRGQIILDHTALSEAIKEMNRYSTVQLVIDDPAVAELQITGVFRSGDSLSFARAISESHQLRMVQEHRRIHLRP